MSLFHRRALSTLTLLALSAGTVAQLDADFTASPLSGHNPLTVQFTNQTTGATPPSFKNWDYGDGTTSGGANPTHTYGAPGLYTVSLTVVSGLQVDTETKVDFIEVLPAEIVPDFTASPTSGTNPLTVTFTDASTGTPADSWSWSVGQHTWPPLPNEPSIEFTYNSPGLYSVTFAAIVGSEAVSITKTDLIEVLPAPYTPSFSASPTNGSNPVTVSFTNTTTGTPPNAWLWQFGDGHVSTEQHPTHTYSLPGDHDVTLTASVGTESKSITALDFVQITPAPLFPDFTADVLAGALPLTVSFTDLTTGVPPTGWKWSLPGPDSSEQHPVHTFTEPGTHSVMLKVFSGDQEEILTRTDLVTVVPPPARLETLQLHPVDPEGESYFGGRVRVSGSTAVVSTVLDPLSPWGPPALSVIELEEGTELFKIDPEFGEGGGAFDVDGDLVLYGAPGSDLAGPDHGAAHLYDLATGDRVGTLLPTNGNEGSHFGRAVALDGNLALVGARVDDEAGPGRGAVYIYDVSEPTAPVLHTKFTVADDSPPYIQGIGASVAVSGDRALVGVVPWTFWPPILGSAYLLDLSDPTDPSILATPWPDNGGNAETFGLAVALSGSFAVLGAPNDHVAGLSGAAYLFDAEDGAFLGKLLPLDDVYGKHFGASVAIQGKTVVVGDTGDAVGGQSAGAAYLFDAATLEQQARLVAGDAAIGDRFGASVALDGDRVLVGTFAVDYLTEDPTGAAYLYEIPPPTAWEDLGQGLPGAAGTPRLSGTGTTSGPCTLHLELDDAAPFASSFLVAGFELLSAPFLGGVLVPAPDVVVAGLETDEAGGWFLAETLPAGFAPSTLVFQSWIADAAGPSGYAASNAVRATTP